MTCARLVAATLLALVAAPADAVAQTAGASTGIPAPATVTANDRPVIALDAAAAVTEADAAARRDDEVAARRLYLRACEAQHPRACLEVAVSEFRGDGGPVAKAAALAHAGPHLAAVERACEAGELAACASLGSVVRYGVGVPSDFKRAVAVFQQACDAGSMKACGSLGIQYHMGTGVPKDPARAAELYRRSCEGGYLRRCSQLGGMYLVGTGVAKDALRAVALLRRACDGGSGSGCSNLGVAYERGAGIVKDPARALALYRQSCERGEVFACCNLGAEYEAGVGVAKDLGRARALYEQACDGGAMRACANLGALYEAGAGVAVDLPRAVTLYQQACDGDNDARGCARLSRLYAEGTIATSDEVSVLAAHRTACGNGVTMACWELGVSVPENVAPEPSNSALYTLAVTVVVADLLAPVPHYILGDDRPIVLAWPIRPGGLALVSSKRMLHGPLLVLTPSIEPQYRIGEGWRVAELLRLSVSRTSKWHNTLGMAVEGGLIQGHGQRGSVLGAMLDFGRHANDVQFSFGIGARRSVLAGVAQYDVFLDFHLGVVVGAEAH